MPSPRTFRAVSRQLQAMACPEYEVGIRDRATGKMALRTWSPSEVLHSLPWLRRQNAGGCDIYIRPLGSRGLLLLDDLLYGTLDRMVQEGVEPALVTRTSPQNYQAWVRVSTEPISERLATAAAKLLADRFQADPNSADWRHFGRLAGFTNQKPTHRDETGRSPFVLLWDATGRVASARRTILQEASARLAVPPSAYPLPVYRSPAGLVEDPAVAFQSFYARQAARYGAELDRSRTDWSGARVLLSAGHPIPVVFDVMFHNSPDLADRKKGHEEDYLLRTLASVLGLDANVRPLLAQHLPASTILEHMEASDPRGA